MAARPVVVYPPAEGGGRRVRVDGRILGTAYTLHDLTVFLERSGLEGVDELDVAASDLIEWRGGGPDDWESTEKPPARCRCPWGGATAAAASMRG
jgi:hypothetical protein